MCCALILVSSISDYVEQQWNMYKADTDKEDFARHGERSNYII
jgi:hypothetical protein